MEDYFGRRIHGSLLQCMQAFLACIFTNALQYNPPYDKGRAKPKQLRIMDVTSASTSPKAIRLGHPLALPLGSDSVQQIFIRHAGTPP